MLQKLTAKFLGYQVSIGWFHSIFFASVELMILDIVLFLQN